MRSAAFQGFCPHERRGYRTRHCVLRIQRLEVDGSVARHLAATETPGNRNNYPSCTRSTTLIPGVLLPSPPLNTHGQICDSVRLQQKNHGSKLPSHSVRVPIRRPVAAVPPFVVRGWSMGGGVGMDARAPGSQGQFGAVHPRRYSRVPVGPRKPSFCLKRSQRLMRRLGRSWRARRSRQPVWVRPILEARGTRLRLEPLPAQDSSIHLRRPRNSHVLPRGRSGSAEPQFWGLGLGLDLDLDLDLVLFASAHCVISRPVLAGPGRNMMTAFLAIGQE